MPSATSAPARARLPAGAAGGRAAAGRGACAVAATVSSTRGRPAVDPRVIATVAAAVSAAAIAVGAVSTLVVAVRAAAPAVLAEERCPADRALRLWEVAAEVSLGDRHELVPDLGRERPAGHRDAVHAAHLLERVGVADPDRGGEVRRVSVEPGVVEVVGGA